MSMVTPLERLFGSVGDHLRLELGHGDEDVDSQLVRMWIVGRHKLDAGFHQTGNEMNLTG